MTTTMRTMTAYDYDTGAELGELTEEQSQEYAWWLAEHPHLADVGAVDGADYGFPGRTIYAVNT